MADASDQASSENTPSEGTDTPEKEDKKKGSKKMLLFIVIGVVAVLGGVAAFLFLTESGRHMIGLSSKQKEHTEKKSVLPTSLIFYKMPEMMVNLTPSGKRTAFLRLGIKLELPDAESQKALDLLLPRVIDQFQMYLRELHIEDIEGSAGIHRLREELLKRVNAVTNPIKIKDVLFEVLLVQ